MKMTQWYSGDQKPVHIGPFLRKYKGIAKPKYCWWDGRYFGCSAETPELAKLVYDVPGISLQQNLPWRGVAK